MPQHQVELYIELDIELLRHGEEALQAARGRKSPDGTERFGARARGSDALSAV